MVIMGLSDVSAPTKRRDSSKKMGRRVEVNLRATVTAKMALGRVAGLGLFAISLRSARQCDGSRSGGKIDGEAAMRLLTNEVLRVERKGIYHEPLDTLQSLQWHRPEKAGNEARGILMPIAPQLQFPVTGSGKPGDMVAVGFERLIEIKMMKESE